METKLLTVSHSPHIHQVQSIPRIMYDVVIALLPALIFSVYVFGLGALMVTLAAVLSSLFFEYVIAKYIIKRKPDILDGSAIITGILLAFNVPSNLPIWIVVIGSFVAIGIGKMSFGGLGNNPFNPALVGRVFLLISFPVQMTTWPVPFQDRMSFADTVTGATPLSIIKEGIKNGESMTSLMKQIPSYTEFLIGSQAGSLGEISAFLLILGFLYLVYRKVITWHIPVTIIATMFIFSGILWLGNPEQNMDPIFHILTGGAMLGAIYMATDYVTSPMSIRGMYIYSVGIGVITILIRVFGAYPEGVSFAILILNAFVPLINKYVKPISFGEKVKNG
ncbi:MAG: RnfABCDGE type electron transport complex subunit D [Cyclobacteriaceae bacterium]|nr:RnfABCDGE type electron transport complex subunit D [Cyclobacteriaceae bacterium]